eukprot:jgi/Botrbrau1/9305/Bobra.0111s0029.1
MMKASTAASYASQPPMRALAALLLLSILMPSTCQRAFQGPPDTEAAWRASAGNGTQEGDYAAIMLVRESLATYKAQRARLHWNDSDPCGMPTCNQTCNWKGLVCREWRITGVVLDGKSLGEEAAALEEPANMDHNALLFSGTLSEVLSRLDMLQVLQLPNHRIHGTLPTSLGRLSQLKVVDLSGNLLRGSLPLNWGGMRSLTTLNVAGNQLHGTIPSEWLFLTNLTQLNISGNQELCDWPVLQHMVTYAEDTATTNCPPRAEEFMVMEGPVPGALPERPPSGAGTQGGLQSNISMVASVVAALMVLLLIVFGMWHKRKQDVIQQRMMVHMGVEGERIPFYRPDWLVPGPCYSHCFAPGEGVAAARPPPPVLVLSPDGQMVSFAVRLPGKPVPDASPSTCPPKDGRFAAEQAKLSGGGPLETGTAAVPLSCISSRQQRETRQQALESDCQHLARQCSPQDRCQASPSSDVSRRGESASVENSAAVGWDHQGGATHNPGAHQECGSGGTPCVGGSGVAGEGTRETEAGRVTNLSSSSSTTPPIGRESAAEEAVRMTGRSLEPGVVHAGRRVWARMGRGEEKSHDNMRRPSPGIEPEPFRSDNPTPPSHPVPDPAAAGQSLQGPRATATAEDYIRLASRTDSHPATSQGYGTGAAGRGRAELPEPTTTSPPHAGPPGSAGNLPRSWRGGRNHMAAPSSGHGFDGVAQGEPERSRRTAIPFAYGGPPTGMGSMSRAVMGAVPRESRGARRSSAWRPPPAEATPAARMRGQGPFAGMGINQRREPGVGRDYTRHSQDQEAVGGERRADSEGRRPRPDLQHWQFSGRGPHVQEGLRREHRSRAPTPMLPIYVADLTQHAEGT